MNLYQQYSNIKNQHSDALLFYRVGDFYELFGKDAIKASEVLDLTLTSRDCGQAERVPMCGVPYHSVELYIKKLIEAGYKTAICEPSKVEPIQNEAKEPHSKLNLIATGKEQIILKEFLEANASDVLLEKINNGVFIEKDGKSLLSKKDLTTFMKYACDEAQKQAEKGARFACIDHQTVFGWLIHYFEEDSIEGTLYNEDGTEYKPKPAPRSNTAKTSTVNTVTKPKANNQQGTLFDLMSWQTPAAEETKLEDIKLETAADEPEADETDTELDEPVTEDNEPEADEDDIPKGLHQVSETEWADEDGVIYEVAEVKREPVKTANETIPSVLTEIFGNTLILR